MLLAPVPPVIAPVLAAIPAAAYPTDSYRGSAGHRGGPRNRSPSQHPSACTSTSSQHLRLLP
jgi:hypothetical protein